MCLHFNSILVSTLPYIYPLMIEFSYQLSYIHFHPLIHIFHLCIEHSRVLNICLVQILALAMYLAYIKIDMLIALYILPQSHKKSCYGTHAAQNFLKFDFICRKY